MEWRDSYLSDPAVLISTNKYKKGGNLASRLFYVAYNAMDRFHGMYFTVRQMIEGEKRHVPDEIKEKTAVALEMLMKEAEGMQSELNALSSDLWGATEDDEGNT